MLGLALALALLAPGPASGAQGEPPCAADKTLAVTFEAREGGRNAPLVATHEVTLVAEWPGEVRSAALSVPEGIAVLQAKPRQIRLIAPAGTSLAVTASWVQAADPSDPDSDVSDPANRCSAAQTIALPITAAEPPRARYDLAGRRSDYASLAVVPARAAGDHSPLTVSVRVVRAARFPSPRSRATTMTVAMRPSERVQYRRHIPSPQRLVTPLWCRSYNLVCSPTRPLFVEVNALPRTPLPPSQPYRQVASGGLRVNAFTFSPRPDREPRTFAYGIGYDVQVHQSGRRVARQRRAVRCGKTSAGRYYCDMVRRRNG